MRIHLCRCNLYSESIKLLGIFSIAQNPIKSNRFSKFLRIMVFSSVTLIQSYNKRQNALASIKHLTPLLLPVNKGSKAFEKGKRNHHNRRLLNTTLQCVLRRFLPVSLVLYERNGYASIKHLTPVSLRPKSLIDSGKKQVKAQSPDKAYATIRFNLRSV